LGLLAAGGDHLQLGLAGDLHLFEVAVSLRVTLELLLGLRREHLELDGRAVLVVLEDVGRVVVPRVGSTAWPPAIVRFSLRASMMSSACARSVLGSGVSSISAIVS
jgi:hypothetical protein